MVDSHMAALDNDQRLDSEQQIRESRKKDPVSTSFRDSEGLSHSS